jgi:hypothetical protein
VDGASGPGAGSVHQHVDAGGVPELEAEGPHSFCQPFQIAAVDCQINVTRHPRGQRVALGDVQKYGYAAYDAVFDTGCAQSGGNAVQYLEELFHVLVVGCCGNHKVLFQYTAVRNRVVGLAGESAGESACPTLGWL